MSLGIIFALSAMVCWGFGDFLIQRSTRKVGDFQTLFLITLFGSAVLLPFVWSDLVLFVQTISSIMLIVLTAGIVLFVAALLEFEALRIGKISVIEPTWSIEIPAAAILAGLILNETLTFYQILTMILLIVGLFMVSYRGQAFSKRFFLEKGVFVSIMAALLMGVANFFVGWGARETSPLLINFIISFVSLVGAFIFLLINGKIKDTINHAFQYPKTIIPMVILDNGAWITFAFAMVYAPIGITVALSESYIIIAVILGIFVGKEKLEKHQKYGLILALFSAITLALTTL